MIENLSVSHNDDGGVIPTPELRNSGALTLVIIINQMIPAS